VSEGLKTTFELLTATENEAAVQVLVLALESTNRYIQDAALHAILDRRSHVGQHEIIRRLHLLDDRTRAVVYEHRASFAQALRDAVLSTDPRVIANGCEAALWFREYDLMSTLVSAMEDSANSNAALAATTLLSLAEHLDDELTGPRDYRHKRDPQIARRHALGCLQQSVLRYGMHRRLEPIEAFLLLASRENATLKHVLMDPMHGSYLVVLDVLRHSQRQGIVRLVLGYLDVHHAPLSALHVLAHRGDRAFVERLLQKIGGEPSAVVQANLKRLEHFSWLEGDLSFVDGLSDVAQHSAVQLIMASGINRAEAFRLVEHMAARGKPIGRRAAAAALAKFTGAEANTLALRLLKDEDPLVQATAARQLRHRGIPGALTILIDLVDSPHRVVRAAARESLTEFSFKRFLGAFDMLDDEVRRSTGMLVAKIDPTTLPSLKAELESPSARRRARGLVVALAIGLARGVEQQAVSLLYDDDPAVRGEAARLLGDCDGETALASLRAALEDSSPAVQEAAADSLQRIETRPVAAGPLALTPAELETADE
jgi:HEAT repeats